VPEVFATLRDVSPAGTASTTATVRVTTDIAVKLKLAWYPLTEPPGIAGGSGTFTESSPTAGTRTISISLGAGHQGDVFGFDITAPDAPGTAPSLRPYSGVFQMLGSRVAPNAVPVRFFGFGGAPPAPAGGGTGANAGSWNQYTWAQWNPKGT